MFALNPVDTEHCEWSFRTTVPNGFASVTLLGTPTMMQIDDGLGGWLTPLSAVQTNAHTLTLEYSAGALISATLWRMQTDPQADVSFPHGWIYPANGTI